ncbi:hypothetical protein BH24GEM2_BH24GEM2_06460 [soil metagenome]|jgi:hypothetical protein
MFWKTQTSTCASLLVLLAGLSLSACEYPTIPAAMGAVAGTYIATELSVTENGARRDLLADGVSIQINLQADGATTGVFHFPAQGGKPAYDVDLTGTWAVTGSDGKYTVTFNQPNADTFLRDTAFTLNGHRLEGLYGALRAVLQKKVG